MLFFLLRERGQRKPSPGSADSEIGIFERFEDNNLEVSDDEAEPKRKLRRVIVADSSSENEDEKSVQPTVPQKQDGVEKKQEKPKSSFSSWSDAVCSVCKYYF